MRFSVVTPTRNALMQLQRCVGSVRQQRAVSIEHLVQDACSTDGTPEWLASQSGLLWKSERDTGMYDAINRGWERAEGDVFSWLNSDEQYLPGTLGKVAEIFRQHPDVDWVFGDYIVVDAHGKAIAARREVPLRTRQLLYGILPAASCTMFFRRRLWDVGQLRLDSGYRFAADLKLVLQLLVSGRRVLHVRDYLSLFAFDGSNLSCSPGMLQETAKIQRSFDARDSVLLKLLERGVRVGQKMFSGSYGVTDISYHYVLDDSGAGENRSARSLGGRYKTQ